MCERGPGISLSSQRRCPHLTYPRLALWPVSVWWMVQVSFSDNILKFWLKFPLYLFKTCPESVACLSIQSQPEQNEKLRDRLWCPSEPGADSGLMTDLEMVQTGGHALCRQGLSEGRRWQPPPASAFPFTSFPLGHSFPDQVCRAYQSPLVSCLHNADCSL